MGFLYGENESAEIEREEGLFNEGEMDLGDSRG